MWEARTDDPANRVEFIFHDLPIEARWSQWRRGVLLGVLVIPACGWLVWVSLAWAGLGPLWVLASAAAGTVVGVGAVVAVLARLGRYDTPVTPLAYHLAVLRAEIRAPRAPADTPPAPVAGPSFDPVWPDAPVATPPDLTRSPHVCDCDPWPPPDADQDQRG